MEKSREKEKGKKINKEIPRIVLMRERESRFGKNGGNMSHNDKPTNK